MSQGARRQLRESARAECSMVYDYEYALLVLDQGSQAVFLATRPR